MPAASLPSPSGARLSGDDYQHLFTWLQALPLLDHDRAVARIEFERRDAGNVDDLIVHFDDGRTLYHQVKFVRDQQAPLDAAWFTTVPRGGKRSPLQRFHESYVKLSTPGTPAEMVLHTNRQVVHGDPILRHIDGKTDRLVPRLAVETSGSASGKARAGWAAHLGIAESDLLDMLAHLRIRAGRASLEELRDNCLWAMRAVGLRGDVNAIDLGVAEIRKLIEDGCDSLDCDALRAIVAERQLGGSAREATLLIQGLKRDPWPEAATASVDWVDLYAEDMDGFRRRLREPAAFDKQIKPELKEAVSQIERRGFKNIHILGRFRLSTALLVGRELPRMDVAVSIDNPGTGRWVSGGKPAPFELEVAAHEVGEGPGLAIALAVAGDNVTGDAQRFLTDAGMPVRSLVSIRPAAGANRYALEGAEDAWAWANATFDAIRDASAQLTGDLHLFMQAPAAAIVLLGHIWNRLPRTQVYDDLGQGQGYARVFELVS